MAIFNLKRGLVKPFFLKGCPLALMLLVKSWSCLAQVDTMFLRQRITYSDYLHLVVKNNLAYTAEKFNINLAEAGIEAARIFPDPELGFGWFDNGQKRLNMGYGFASEIGWQLELGGKRRARINLAKSQVELTRHLLADYFRNLRADATLKYLQAIQNKLLFDVLRNSYLSMYQLAKSDSLKYRLGSITEVDSHQSQLEAGSMLNDVFGALSDWKNALTELSVQLGSRDTDTLKYPTGGFSSFARRFNLKDLITTAQNNRADLQAAMQNKNVAQNLLKLAKANRIIDLGIGGGYTYASYDRNIIAPTPSFSQLHGGISIPIKASNNYPAEIKMAYYTTLQTEIQYKQIELLIKSQVTQAYNNYVATQQQVNQYNTGLLTKAKSVLEGRRYSYQRGETSLLEVLVAQRTYNEVQRNYYQTLYNYGAALVELERAIGIWDIDF